jgi:hypothetical protein
MYNPQANSSVDLLNHYQNLIKQYNQPYQNTNQTISQFTRSLQESRYPFRVVDEL